MAMQSKKKIMIAAIAGSMAAALIIGGGSFAFLKDNAETITNNFKTNKVDVDLDEDKGAEQSYQYEIIPGTEQEKDPVATIDNTVDAYLFVTVTDETEDLVTYTIADDWIPFAGHDGVYYREVAADATDKEFRILKDNKVSYETTIENDDMAGKENLKLSFDVFGIQKAGFADAAAAYAQAPVGVTDAQALEAGIRGATAGNPVSLQVKEDMDDIRGFQTNAGQEVTIDLNGKTVAVKKSVGSSGTESQGMQVLKGSKLTVKNGTFTYNPENANFIWAIHTYGDLVLDNVTIDTTDTPSTSSQRGYVLICDYGTTTVRGNTNLIAPAGAWAVQVEDGSGTYYNKDGTVTKVVFEESMTGTVDGLIIMSDKSNSNPETKPELVIKGGTFKNTGLTLDEFKTYVADGYKATEESAGVYVVTKA